MTIEEREDKYGEEYEEKGRSLTIYEAKARHGNMAATKTMLTITCGLSKKFIASYPPSAICVKLSVPKTSSSDKIIKSLCQNRSFFKKEGTW